MTVYEMHIELEQGLGQVAAARGRKYLPEEKDFYLNKVQNRFIQNCLKARNNGGFEINQTDVDKIQTLIVSNLSVVPYIVPGKNRYKCYLPYDYQYLLSDYSETLPISPDDMAAADGMLYMDAIRQQRSTLTSPPYYAVTLATIKGTQVWLPNDLPYGQSYVGFPMKEDIQFISPYIALKGRWYWERAGEYSYPGHYIRLSSTAGSGDTKVVVDGVESLNIISSTQAVTHHHTVNGDKVTNRLTASDRVHELGIPFYRTSVYSPISELSGGLLYVYNDNSFTVTSAGISYIRKPQPISLSLNTGSELPEQFHPVLCDLVIEHLKGKVENQVGMAIAERDIEKRVIL